MVLDVSVIRTKGGPTKEVYWTVGIFVAQGIDGTISVHVL